MAITLEEAREISTNNMSVEMKKAFTVAAEVEKDLRATDPRFHYTVSVHHEEGSRLFFRYAFLMRWYDKDHGNWGASKNPGEWLFIFTEHHGFHVYPLEDLADYNIYVEDHRGIEDHPDYPEDAWICTCCEERHIDKMKQCFICNSEELRPLTEKEKQEEREEYALYGEEEKASKIIEALNQGAESLNDDEINDLLEIWRKGKGENGLLKIWLKKTGRKSSDAVFDEILGEEKANLVDLECEKEKGKNGN